MSASDVVGSSTHHYGLTHELHKHVIDVRDRHDAYLRHMSENPTEGDSRTATLSGQVGQALDEYHRGYRQLHEQRQKDPVMLKRLQDHDHTMHTEIIGDHYRTKLQDFYDYEKHDFVTGNMHRAHALMLPFEQDERRRAVERDLD